MGPTSSPTTDAISDGVGCAGMLTARSRSALHPLAILAASALISSGAIAARSGGRARRKARMISLRSGEFALPTPDRPTSLRLPDRLLQRLQNAGFGGPGATVVDDGLMATALVPRTFGIIQRATSSAEAPRKWTVSWRRSTPS